MSRVITQTVHCSSMTLTGDDAAAFFKAVTTQHTGAPALSTAPTPEAEPLKLNEIVNLTQDIGECGAARVHELGKEPLTIFTDAELEEFVRAIEARCSVPVEAQQGGLIHG